MPTAAPVDSPADPVDGPEGEGSGGDGGGEEEDPVGEGESTEDDGDEFGVVVASLMFHPTTAMAPTIEFFVNVVVAIFHDVDCVAGVDANVKVSPERTTDWQSPATDPGTPFASE